MYLTSPEYRKLVEDVANAVVAKLRPYLQKRLTDGHPDTCTWLTPKEAAEMLRISVGQLYHIKDQLTCIKLGKAQSAPIRFRKETIMVEYAEARIRCQKDLPGTAEEPGRQGETARLAATGDAPPKGAEI